MNRTLIYIDEDSSSHSLTRALRSLGIDVISSLEIGMNGRTDEEQLRRAIELQRPIYSFNVGDFCALNAKFLRSGQHHFGIVLGGQQRWSPGEQARRMARLLEELGGEAMRDRLEFLSNW